MIDRSPEKRRFPVFSGGAVSNRQAMSPLREIRFTRKGSGALLFRHNEDASSWRGFFRPRRGEGMNMTPCRTSSPERLSQEEIHSGAPVLRISDAPGTFGTAVPGQFVMIRRKGDPPRSSSARSRSFRRRRGGRGRLGICSTASPAAARKFWKNETGR
jgi:hypothetical protein